MDGIINVYKEPGYTSFDVVAKLRGILKQKKIGHTGTLDPMAEGVLLVCVGKATKLVELMTYKDKEYEAVMTLGFETDTEDITGKVTAKGVIDSGLSANHIIDVTKSYKKEYMQIPPMYSAIKKDGKKLYDYARAGIEIEREPRPVKIYSIDDISVNMPEVAFSVKCSKGTYIRSLCRDIGRDLGCFATLKSLKRSDVNGYQAKDALKLSDIEALVQAGELDKYVIPMDSFLDKYKSLNFDETFEKCLLNGNKITKDIYNFPDEYADGELIRVYLDDRFIALYQYISSKNELKPYRMFL